MAAVYPDPQFVAPEAGAYGPNGNDYTGTLALATQESVDNLQADIDTANAVLEKFTFDGDNVNAKTTGITLSLATGSKFGVIHMNESGRKGWIKVS